VAGQQIDREKLRAAIRRMGSDYLFLMLDAAITILPEDSLRKLVNGFLNPDLFASQAWNQVKARSMFVWINPALVKTAVELTFDYVAHSPYLHASWGATLP